MFLFRCKKCKSQLHFTNREVKLNTYDQIGHAICKCDNSLIRKIPATKINKGK